MTDKSKRATLGRKVFVSIALTALLGIFLALYYFIYIPQQEVLYNKGTFRILNEISGNFTASLVGSDIAAKSEGANHPLKYHALENNDLVYDSFNIKQKLTDLEGKPETINTTAAAGSVLTASYNISPSGDSARKVIAKTFEPILSIHGNTFESLILIHLQKPVEQQPHTGQLIYKSSGLAIDEEINVDSLLKKTPAFTFPVVNDINIQGDDYKLFLFPFRIQHEKFLLGGFVSRHNFKVHTHNFPVISLVILGILLISVLLSLPFLKVFLIGPQENISVRDVRSVIAMIYIIPFFLVLLGSGIWLQYINNVKANTNLDAFNEQVKTNFYNEIKQSISQLKNYDLLYNNTKAGFYNMAGNEDAGLIKTRPTSFTDAYMHPSIYKNLDGVFWINSKGEEIAKWNLIDSLPAFFNKDDRQYFQDIKNNAGYHLPGDTNTFSIQPTLAKSTGYYTISVAIKSASRFTNDTAVLIGLHGKMYSVFKPVVPRGLSFCIINSAGDILYHSESDRSLQENLFDELDDSNAIKVAVSHKTNLLLDNAELYENKVKLLMKPMDGLPYFLVTYSNNKIDLLFILHIIAFSFFCESMLLLIIAVLTLLYYHSSNKFSKLFFAENDLNFTKPAPHKTEYYKRILYYQLAIFILMGIAFIFFNGKDLLSYVLYTSILLPVFSVIGYYLIRAVENYNDEKASTERDTITGFSLQNAELSKNIRLDKVQIQNKKQQLLALFSNKQFVNNFIKIIIPYAFLIWIFFIIKSNVVHIPISPAKSILAGLIGLFTIVFPLMAISISMFGLPKWLVVKKRILKGKHSYLSYFILAIMLSSALTSVMPTLGFILFSAGQEKSLQLKARQVYLADALMEHCKYINDKIAETKLSYKQTGKTKYNSDSLFVESLKFSTTKGIYLRNNNLSFENGWANNNAQNFFNNSNFYKQITQYLFLPTEHSDYFDNSNQFYYWLATPDKKEKKDSLLFHYKNTGDNVNPANIVISSVLPPQPSFFSVFKYRLGIIIILAVLLLLIVFYKIIYSASKRIFLIDYFDKTPGAEQDTAYLNKEFFEKEDLSNKKFDRDFWGNDRLSLEMVKVKEKDYTTTEQKEESILKIENLLAQLYENIWRSLSSAEQFVLYDFAIDGFSNYKNVDVLYSLYKKGIIEKKDNSFIIMTNSFRNYLISKTGTDEINILKREISEGGAWGNLRTVLLIIIFLIIVFLFIVQEDVSKRVFAIVTSVGAAIPIILKLFDRNLTGGGNTTDVNKK